MYGGRLLFIDIPVLGLYKRDVISVFESHRGFATDFPTGITTICFA